MAISRVLFLCTANSARSQMAEALLRKRAGARVEAYSAGIEPGVLNPLTVRVLSEAGVDTSALYAKSVDLFAGETHFDYVITVCSKAEERCPVFRPLQFACIGPLMIQPLLPGPRAKDWRCSVLPETRSTAVSQIGLRDWKQNRRTQPPEPATVKKPLQKLICRLTQTARAVNDAVACSSHESEYQCQIWGRNAF